MPASILCERAIGWHVGLAGLVAALAVVVFAGAVRAESSRLQQQVEEPICAQPGDCDMTSPVIKSAKSNDGWPRMFGKYDATFTEILRVTFGGRVYQLGVDSELTAQNGWWQLDLSGLSAPLPPGEYDIEVEQVGYDGQIVVVRSSLQVTNEVDPGENGDNSGDGGESSGGRPTPNVPNTGIAQVSKQVGTFASGILALAAIALTWRQLRRRKTS